MRLTVDTGVDEFIDFVNLRAELLGIVGESSLLLGDELIERSVEDTDDLRAFVVDDCMSLLVPQDGDCEPATIIGIGLEIQVLDVLRLIEGVYGGAREGIH